MSESKMQVYRETFLSRLSNLSHILEVSIEHFQTETDSIIDYRLIDDMLPFGTQIIFACNQPRNFARWCKGLKMENLKPEIESLKELRKIIEETKSTLINANIDDEKLKQTIRIDISEQQYLELAGIEYVNDFLIPNLYFHLVTAYNIMRMKGAPLGKVNYMLHLVPKINQL